MEKSPIAIAMAPEDTNPDVVIKLCTGRFREAFTCYCLNAHRACKGTGEPTALVDISRRMQSQVPRRKLDGAHVMLRHEDGRALSAFFNVQRCGGSCGFSPVGYGVPWNHSIDPFVFRADSLTHLFEEVYRHLRTALQQDGSAVG